MMGSSFLYDSKLRSMEVLRERGNPKAGRVADYLKVHTVWSNTTCTVVKKCIEKGYIQRLEPGGHCQALLTKEQPQQGETQLLVKRLFDGDADRFVSYGGDRGF